jgi:hypothetical protein
LIGDRRKADVVLVVAQLGGGVCELWFCPHVPITSQLTCRPAGLSVGSSPTKDATSGAATQLSSGPAGQSGAGRWGSRGARPYCDRPAAGPEGGCCDGGPSKAAVFSQAEGVGFEPTMRLTPHSGFQDRRHRPLGEPSADNDSAVTVEVTQRSVPCSAGAALRGEPVPGPRRGRGRLPGRRRSRLRPEILRLTPPGLGEQPEQPHDQCRRQERDHPSHPELVLGVGHRPEDDQTGHRPQHPGRG